MAIDLQGLVKSRHDRVVAAEPLDGGGAVLYTRQKDGVTEKRVEFQPFVLLANPVLLNGCGSKFELVQLKGEGAFTCLAKFPDADSLDDALKHLRKTTGFTPSAPNAPYKAFSDACQQLMTGGEFRLFRGMAFGDVLRMQFDIETLRTPGFDFSNPEREADKIIIISMCDSSGWEKVISLDELPTEKALLEEFVRTVRERDPDVLEGHNIFRFDLPYIEERAKRHKVRLLLGRDGSAVKKRNSRVSIAERTINYTRYDAFGRHFVDTYFMVQLYDVSHRELEGYGLKHAAAHFGVAAEDRTYLDASDIQTHWDADRKRLLKYALDDARETRAISAILSPSYFCQTQLAPLKYQDCVVRGNATRIDAMLVAEYLAKGRALPLPEPPRQFSGGLTKAFHAGVFENVWHCDVRSLYPSVILAEKLTPSRDALGVFPTMLEKLREFRLEAKDAEKKAATREEKDNFNALQTSFKILINSFYGYLGFAQGVFNDYEMAEKVTAKGREILTSMLNFLEGKGANVIEMDTDGIYFQPPAGVKDPAEMERMIQGVLPKGIEVELDDTHPAMFCYKSKNYALLLNNGDVAVTGAALKSRGLEPFQRAYIRKSIEFLLKEDYPAMRAMHEEFHKDISERRLPLARMAKSETLSSSLDTYKKDLADGGKRSAPYELAIKSGRNYRQGDQVAFYVTGEKKTVSVVDNSRLLSDAPAGRDDNIAYYLSKLEELRKKFAEFVPSEKMEKGGGHDNLL